MRDETIRQTAIDYDTPYETVKRIHDQDPDKIYENMEEYIKQRANAESEGFA